MEEYHLFNKNDILECIFYDPSTIESLELYTHSVKTNFSREELKNIIIENIQPSWYKYLRHIGWDLEYNPIVLQKCLPEAIIFAIKYLPYIDYNIPNVIIDNQKFQKGMINWMIENNKIPYNFEKVANNKNFMKIFLEEPKVYNMIPQVLKYSDIVITDNELLKILVDKIEPTWYDYLPPKIASKVEVQKNVIEQNKFMDMVKMENMMSLDIIRNGKIRMVS